MTAIVIQNIKKKSSLHIIQISRMVKSNTRLDKSIFIATLLCYLFVLWLVCLFLQPYYKSPFAEGSRRIKFEWTKCERTTNTYIQSHRAQPIYVHSFHICLNELQLTHKPSSIVHLTYTNYICAHTHTFTTHFLLAFVVSVTCDAFTQYSAHIQISR